MSGEQPSSRASVSFPNWGVRSAGYFVLLVAGANVVLALVEQSWAAWLGFIVVLLVLIGLRLVRTGVRIDSDGFVSRSALATRHLRWDQVKAFNRRGFAVEVQLIDGAWQPIQVYGASSASGKDLVNALAAVKQRTSD